MMCYNCNSKVYFQPLAVIAVIITALAGAVVLIGWQIDVCPIRKLVFVI